MEEAGRLDRSMLSKLKTETSALQSTCRNQGENIRKWAQGEHFGKGREKRWDWLSTGRRCVDLVMIWGGEGVS